MTITSSDMDGPRGGAEGATPLTLRALTERVEYVSAGYAEEFGINRTDEWIVLKLAEEVGELVQAYLSEAGQSRDRGVSGPTVSEELADVVCMCLVLANRREVDVEAAIADKWFRYEQHHRERGFDG